VLNLALLQPGVAPVFQPTQGVTAFGTGLGIRVHGSRGVENNVTLDGSNNNEVAVGSTSGNQPRPDAVQEFRLLTSNFEAEFGRNTGAVVNVVTKSGANDFHGNARFFYRPTFLSAARFFDNAAGRPLRGTDDFRRRFERKEFGGNIGGPIWLPKKVFGPAGYDGRNRTFFFFDLEARRQLIGDTRTISNLPTGEERNGIFTRRAPNATTAPTPLLDPTTGAPFPIISGTVAPGQTIRQQIPTGRFSPIALYYLPFFPTADASGQAVAAADEITDNEWLTTRVDHALTDKQSLNLTFNRVNASVLSPFPFGGPPNGPSVPGFGSVDKRLTNNAVLRHTYALTPTLVNSFLFGYARNNQPSFAPANATTPAQIGFTGNFVIASQFAGPPYIRLFDRGLALGNTFQGPQHRVTENFQIQDSVSWAKGDHRFKFGFDGTLYKHDQTFLFVNQGIITFSSTVTPSNTTGDDLADFLIGNSPAAIQFGSNGERDFRQRAIGAFVQDNWRVNESLSLSLGLRYEYTSPITDKFNRIAYYRPGAVSQLLTSGQLRSFEGIPITVTPGGRAPVGVVYVGDPDPVLGGTVPEGGVAKDYNNLAPRIGIAYSPSATSGFLGTLLGNRETVIRAGFGVFYGAIIGDTALQQLTAPGYAGTNAFFLAGGGPLSDPFAPDPFPAFGGTQTQISNPFAVSQLRISAPLNAFSQPIDPLIRTPYVYHHNLTIERGFRRNYVVSASYVGSRGRKLYVREAINPSVGTFIPTPTGRTIPTPTAANVNNRRLNDDIRLAINQLVSAGNSWYNALELNVQKRYSNGLLFQVAYTFSKSINDADTQRGQLDLLDRSVGRALSSDDVPHRLVASVLYDLPFARGSSGAVRAFFGGWSIGGIATFQSGVPFTVVNPFDTTGTGGAILSFADLGTSYQALDPRKNDGRAFNLNAFQAFGNPASGFVLANNFRRGTSGANQFRLNNGINNWDLILAKKTRLWSETTGLELRFEAFNAFNHAQFQTVDLTLGSAATTSPTFGKYLSTRESRVIQLGARFTF
jgi:hypothetical protein